MYRHIFRPARPVWLCTHYLLGRPLSIISFTRRLFPITFHTTITENRENPAHCLAASLATTNRRDGSQPDLYLASNVVIGSVPMREWQPNLYSCIRNREYLTDKFDWQTDGRSYVTCGYNSMDATINFPQNIYAMYTGTGNFKFHRWFKTAFGQKTTRKDEKLSYS